MPRPVSPLTIVPVAHAAASSGAPRAMPWLASWQAFVKVVEGGCMTGAARALHCSRAQVSNQVAELAAHQTLSFLLTDANRWHLSGPDGQTHTLPVTSRLRTNNTDVLLDLALAGHGLAILPTYLIAPCLADGRLVSVLPDHVPHTCFGDTVYACCTPSRARVPKVRVLLDALAAQFEPAPPWAQALSTAR